ncbi:MAG: ATP-dependent helicase, partial [Abditibacteriota bacterium]|nr:ATP-dependent helicase [Abditibacteriota bacterium]
MTQEVFEEKFIAQLNDQQREAVHAVDGAVLLLAVPGSGKTTVLVTRLGYMVYCCGIDPASILTMTYTVAATEDMKKRFASRFGPEYANRMEFRTINGVSSKIIQYYSENHSRRPAFTLLSDDSELNRIVRQIHQAVNDDFAEASLVKEIRAKITFIKNMMLSDEEIAGLDSNVNNLPEIYRRYQEELKRRKAMDYDDQMKYAKLILESCPPVLDHFQERYRYLCVDEAQDTSKIQHTIIQILAQKHGNLFMVGDEDQSIYGFRAAWPDALMRFEEDHPGARVLLMEHNYRSTEEIVAAANAFVSGNRFRREKTIRATQGSGEQVHIITAASRDTQYQYLFHTAQSCETETAVLYRNNDSALPLVDQLERNGVPYRGKFEDTFFSNRLVNDITDFIRFAGSPADGETFLRIYYKFGAAVSKQAAQWAVRQSQQSGKPILEELLNAPNLKPYVRDSVTDLLNKLPLLPKDTATRALRRIWSDLRYGQYAKRAKLDANKFDILYVLAEREPDADSLLRRLDELKSLIQNHQNS